MAWTFSSNNSRPRFDAAVSVLYRADEPWFHAQSAFFNLCLPGSSHLTLQLRRADQIYAIHSLPRCPSSVPSEILFLRSLTTWIVTRSEAMPATSAVV